MVLSAAVLLTGCYKGDIDDLKKKSKDHEERLSALEEWQKTVNSNITALQGAVAALQNNDYVTGVTPITEGGKTVGYTITFTKSDPIKVYHGSEGLTPVISIALHTDGHYYWQVDDGTGACDWLRDADNNMVRVIGDTPKLAIGDDGYWYVSVDGTGTGTPPGAGWTSMGVKAQGDAIFQKDGIDNTSDDYVILTLADGTTITLPKYKPIGISFAQPGFFRGNETKTITFSSTGSSYPTDIRVVDIPAGWKVSVDMSGNLIKIIAPSFVSISDSAGAATVLVADEDRIAAMYTLDLSNGTATTVGGYYFHNGTRAGVVYSTDGTNGMAISIDYTNTLWGSFGPMGASSLTDGLANMAAIYEEANGFEHGQKWIDDKNNGATYASGAKGVWYMPAQNEYVALFAIWNSDKDALDKPLVDCGGIAIPESRHHWSSTVGSDGDHAVYVNSVGAAGTGRRGNMYIVRAVIAF